MSADPVAAADRQTCAAVTCPICHGTDFAAYNGRERAICRGCRSLERGRLQYLVMQEHGLPKLDSRILHVAPESFLYSIFSACSGEKYHACDFSPTHGNYARLPGRVFEFDFCRDIFRLPSSVFDLIVHNHVLEHIPCTVEPVLAEHKRILAPGGFFLFSVPFRDAETREDLSPDLSDEERRLRFGQYDHMRIFGRVDFPDMLQRVFERDDLLFPAASRWSEAELTKCGIPPQLTHGVSGASIFVYQKPS